MTAQMGVSAATVAGTTSANDPRVIGLDLSLSCTGIAGNTGGGWTNTIKPPAKLRGVPRLNYIRDTLTDRYLNRAQGIDLAVVEGPSYGSQAGQSGHHERAGLWWLIVLTLEARSIPYAVMPPRNRAQYATGKGNAGKADVMREVSRRFPWFDGGEDEADALVLAAAGADHLGTPMVSMPVTHRAALGKVAWPDAEHLLAVAA